MVNLVEKVLCVEILEKISRMQRFLRLQPEMASRQGTEVVGIFVTALDGVLANLKAVLERLSEAKTLDKWERLAVIRRLSDTFDSLSDLHTQLQFIYGAWVRPETNVFIKDILEFIPGERRPETVSVIPSNDYSFLETDLSFYLQSVLHSANIKVAFQEKTPTVFLPKIERDNPLNWAILVHECGHTDYEGIEKIFEGDRLIPNGIDTSAKNMLRKWAEEIYCDIFATEILGPAYLASFATFALMSAGAGGAEIATMTHPADIVRICIIRDILEKKGIKVRLTKGWSGYDDVTSFFYNLLEECANVYRKHLSAMVPQPPLPLKLQDFVDTICEQIDELITLSRQITPRDFSRVEHLVSNRLSRGMPIGSYPNPKQVKIAIKGLQKDSLTTSNFNKLKKASQESRTLIWEIVNAGWLHKIKSIYPNAFEIFFRSGDADIQTKMLDWGKQLEGIDRLLLKSVESSEIQRLLEEV